MIPALPLFGRPVCLRQVTNWRNVLPHLRGETVHGTGICDNKLRLI